MAKTLFLDAFPWPNEKSKSTFIWRPHPSYSEIRHQIFCCASGSYIYDSPSVAKLYLLRIRQKNSDGTVSAVQFWFLRAENDLTGGWLSHKRYLSFLVWLQEGRLIEVFLRFATKPSFASKRFLPCTLSAPRTFGGGPLLPVKTVMAFGV